jgi:hypothetical protein
VPILTAPVRTSSCRCCWPGSDRPVRANSSLQKPEFAGPSKIRTSAMTSGYYRTSSPVTALPMIMRWISDVPSKMVKLVEARAVSAGRSPAHLPLVSTNSAPHILTKIAAGWNMAMAWRWWRNTSLAPSAVRWAYLHEGAQGFQPYLGAMTRWPRCVAASAIRSS